MSHEMHLTRRRSSRLVLATVVAALMSSAVVSSAMALGNAKVTRALMSAPVVSAEESSVDIPQLGSTDLSQVGIIEVAPKREEAKNVLVLEPGTSAAAAYFVPLAKSLVEVTKGWQVWAVERRETFLENQKELTKYNLGQLKEKENKLTKK
jgi:hypothetical protein